MSESMLLTVPAEDADARLDAWISTHCPELTRNAVQQLLQKGLILRNGSAAKKMIDCAAKMSFLLKFRRRSH